MVLVLGKKSRSWKKLTYIPVTMWCKNTLHYRPIGILFRGGLISPWVAKRVWFHPGLWRRSGTALSFPSGISSTNAFLCMLCSRIASNADVFGYFLCTVSLFQLMGVFNPPLPGLWVFTNLQIVLYSMSHLASLVSSVTRYCDMMLLSFQFNTYKVVQQKLSPWVTLQ